MYILCTAFANSEIQYTFLKKGIDKLKDIVHVECETIFTLFLMSYFRLVTVLGGQRRKETDEQEQC